MSEIWVIDDDRSVRFVLAEALREAGFVVRDFDNARAALSVLAHARPDAVFTDVRMPGLDGLKFLDTLTAERSDVPVIVMSAYTDVPSTAGAFRGGAFEFLSKPFDLDHAVGVARRAVAGEQAPLPGARAAPEAELIGDAPAMREVFRAIGRVAATQLNVLITGETGTGKELVARALHRHSDRADGPFVALNTAAIPAELLESELFGHEAGAFTGAARRHAGRFEQARGGTLFLDEIGDMPASLQTRLLRVLAEGEFYRVGGRELIRADARVIAATHQDLERKVEGGSFRADLLHRLDVVRVHLPALRERRDDVPLLAERLLARAAVEIGLEPKRFSPRALDQLKRYDWPGNVRQLENLCRRLAVMAPGREILAADLPATGSEAASAASGDWTQALQRWVQAELRANAPDAAARARGAFDRALLGAALEHTGGHRQRAAELLGLGRNTITRKLGATRRRGRLPRAEPTDTAPDHEPTP
jgi:two-component system nitrogen regulation response regulator GlnG